MKKLGNNPIIPGKGVCDPHIHIFNDKAYLYASHDYGTNNPGYRMDDWVIYSSSDLIHWDFESCLRPEETYIGPCHDCWATDAAERNDKYYFYFSQGTASTGVAVSSEPGRGFQDALGSPLLTTECSPTKPYDPAVFIDDDLEKTPYIVFGTPVWAGGDSYYIARMKDNMVSLAEPPRKLLVNDEADDKPYLHKHNGIYYLTWASHYATSDSVYGPYRYRGSLGISPDHGNIFTWNNQWFYAFTIFDPTPFYRATGLCYLHFRENGEMAADQLIAEYGVGQYEAGWNKIEAQWYMASENIRKIEHVHGGFVALGGNGGWLHFPNIHQVPQNAMMAFYAGSTHGGEIEARLGSANGPLLGKAQVPATGRMDWRGYQVATTALCGAPEELDLYLVFRGQGELFLDWFRFYK